MEKILNLSMGNIKLKSTNEEKFLIWNIPSLITCPNSTALCRKNCYAHKSEVRFPIALASREKNLIETKDINFIENMTNTIKFYIKKKSFIGKKVYFRIHESGDFYDLAYMASWMVIANRFPEITFLAYTKSFGLYNELKQYKPDNMIIRASIWDDTKQGDLNIIENLHLPIFTAYPKKTIPYGYFVCGGDCSECKECYTNTPNIAVEIH